MKNIKVLALSATVAGVLLSNTASAELTANVGVTSDYIWRGVTQNGDQAAVSGGVDYSHESGAYAGIWVSSLSGSYEQDLYVGYGGSAGAVSYDVGYIMYQYPLDTNLDFSEITIGLDYANFGLDIAQTIDSDAGGQDSNLYLSVSADFDIGNERSIGVVVGNYDYEDAAATDYTHYQLSLSKAGFTFALDKNDIDGADDMRAVVSWGHEIEL